MNTYITVKEVIDKWDPFDLLAIYAPEDEYESEIKEIVDVIPTVRSSEELAIEIYNIMYNAFNEDFKKAKDCLPIAKRILALLK